MMKIILAAAFFLLMGGATMAQNTDPVTGISAQQFSASFVKPWASFSARRGIVTEQWSAFVSKLRGDGSSDPIKDINTAVNAIPYVTDATNGRPVNYWATPSEFLARGGDCKDYALAKYTALRALGVPAGLMRILVIPEHAVLVVSTPSGPVVLDNLRPDVYPLEARLTDAAVYSVSDAGAWVRTR